MLLLRRWLCCSGEPVQCCNTSRHAHVPVEADDDQGECRSKVCMSTVCLPEWCEDRPSSYLNSSDSLPGQHVNKRLSNEGISLLVCPAVNQDDLCSRYSPTQDSLMLQLDHTAQPSSRLSIQGPSSLLSLCELLQCSKSPSAQLRRMDSGIYIYQRSSSLNNAGLTSSNLQAYLKKLQDMAEYIQGELTWLGAGASGCVYRTNWRGAPAAVKFMLNRDLQHLYQTLDEAVLSRVISHPCIVQTYSSSIVLLSPEDFTEAAGPQAAPAADTEAELARAVLGTCTDAAMHNLLAPADVEASQVSAVQARMAYISLECFGTPCDLDTMGTNASSLRAVLNFLGAKPGMHLTCIVQEYCDRGSLQDAINRGVFDIKGKWGPHLPVRALLKTAREIALGVHHLHCESIIHGDIKPQNVLLKNSRTDRRGFTAKVSDFGLSQLLAHPAQTSIEMSHVATIAYMAPEVMEGRLMKASDVYSFGVVLYHMVASTPPYAGLNHAQIFYGIASGTLAPEWPAHTPPALTRLGRACMAANPEARPSFKDIAQVLKCMEKRLRMEQHRQQQQQQQQQATALPQPGCTFEELAPLHAQAPGHPTP